MLIKLIRHGESMANSGAIPHGSIGDHKIQLTQKGQEQARERGRALREEGYDLDNDFIIYSSPYQRARETLHCVLRDIGSLNTSLPKIYEDPRLREVDHGYGNVEEQDALRSEHGFFYYRFKDGESPADCYDRCCSFTISMMNQVERNLSLSGEKIDPRRDVLIISHGLTIRCFVTQFMHLSVEQFESLANPHNCDCITIGPIDEIENPQFTIRNWAVNGLRFRNQKGDPDEG